MALGERPHVLMSMEEREAFLPSVSDFTLHSLRSHLDSVISESRFNEQIVVMGIVEFIRNTMRPQCLLHNESLPDFTSKFADRLDTESVTQVSRMMVGVSERQVQINEMYMYFVDACEKQLSWRYWTGCQK